MIREYRLRVDPETGDEIWTVECLSIVGEPYYRIHRAEGSDLGEDLTEHYLGSALRRCLPVPLCRRHAVPSLRAVPRRARRRSHV